MTRLLTVVLVLCTGLTSYAQNCTGITETLSVCGFEYDLLLNAENGTFVVTCPDTEAHIALNQADDLLHLTVNQCGEYTLTHTYVSVLEICTIEDVYTLQFSDPSNQQIAISGGLEITYCGGGNGGGNASCATPSSITIAGVAPPTIKWDNCTTVATTASIYDAEVVFPNPATACLVDSIRVNIANSSSNNEDCTSFTQDDFYGVAGVDFLDLIHTTLDIGATISLPANTCTFEANPNPEIDTIIQEITYEIPIYTGGHWSIIQNGSNQFLNDTTNLTLSNDPNYTLIVTPGADYVGPDDVNFELLWYGGELLYGQNLKLEWIEFWEYDTITVVDTLYQTAGMGTCGGLSIVQSGSGGIPGPPDSPFGPITVSFPGMCDCDPCYCDPCLCYPCYCYQPQPTITGNLTFCPETSTTLDAGPGFDFYQWSTGEQTQSIVVDETGSYSVVVFDWYGCEGSDGVIVIEKTELAPIITGDTEICEGEITVLDAGVGFPFYQWSTNAETQTINVSESGTYSVTVYDWYGCEGFSSIEVIENSSPEVDIYTEVLSCSNACVEVVITTSAEYESCVTVGPNNFFAQTSNFSVCEPGIYETIVVGQNGCQTTETFVVNSDDNIPIIDIEIAGSAILTCDNPCTTLIGFTDVPPNCTWWGTNGTTFEGQTIEICAGGDYQVIVTDDANGCTAAATVTIFEDFEPPFVQILPPNPLTPDEPCVLLEASTNVPENCTWQNEQGDILQGTISTLVCEPGIYSVIVTNPNNGCTSTAWVEIEIGCGGEPANFVSLPADININCGDPIPPLTELQYDNGETGACANTGTISGDFVDNYDFCVGGEILYIWEGFDNFGNPLAYTQKISIEPAPPTYIPNAPPDVTLEYGEPLPPPPLVECSNFLVGDCANSGELFITTTSNATPCEGGTIVNTWTGTDLCGKTLSVSQTITVEPVSINVDIESTGIINCNDPCVTLTGIMEADIEPNFVWTGADGTILEGQTIEVCNSGTYSVVVTSQDGCTSEASILVVEDTIEPLITPIIVDQNPDCLESGGTISCPVIDNNIDIVWYGPSGYIGNGIDVEISVEGEYYVILTNSENGCTSTTSTIIDFPEPPQVQIVGSTFFCEGSATYLEVVITNNDTDPSQGYAGCYWDNGSDEPVLEVSTEGCYSVTVVNTVGCTGEAEICVTQGSGLAPVISGQTEFCEGESTILDAGTGFSSYLWNTGETSQTTIADFTGTWTVTVSDASGCTGTEEIDVIVNLLPDISVFADVLNCVNTCVEVVITTSAEYESCVTVGPNNFFAQTSNFSVCEPGIYETIVVGQNGCQTTETFVVNSDDNIPIIDIEIAGSAILTCDNPCTTLIGFTDVPPNCTWWGTNGTTFEGQTIEICAGGDYQVIVTNDANGCTAMAEVTIIEDFVAPVITPIIVDQNPDCTVPEATLSCPVTNPNIVIEWFDTAGNSIGTGTDIEVTTAGDYTVILTNIENGCTSMVTTSIDFPEAPIIQIIGNTEICEGESTTLSVFIDNNDDPNAYGGCDWSDGSSNPNLTVSTGDCYSVTVTNNVGCTAEAEICVNETPNPTPVIIGSTTFCAGTGTTLDAGAGYDSYQWNTGEMSQTTTVSYAGNCVVTVTSNGCTGTASVELTEAVELVPVITGITEFCAGESTVLDAGAGFSSYLWNTGETSQTTISDFTGTWTVTVSDASGCIGTASVETLVFSPPNPIVLGSTQICEGESTTITVINPEGPPFEGCEWATGDIGNTITVSAGGTYCVTAIDENGCTADACVNINVSAPPMPAIQGDTAFCEGGSTTLDAGTGFSSYQWNTGETTQTTTVDYTTTCTVTVTDVNGCIGVASVDVTENVALEAEVIGENVICEGGTAVLQCMFLGGSIGAAYEWSDGSSNSSITVANEDCYSVTIYDSMGCFAAEEICVTYFESLEPTIIGNTTICQGETTILDAGAGFSSYQWSTDATTQMIEINESGTYFLTVTDENACLGFAQIQVTELPEPIAFPVGATEICQGETTIISIVNQNGGIFEGCQWSNGETGNTIVVSQGGSYCVTAFDENGCIAETCFEITVNTIIDPEITGNTEICDGMSTTLAAPGNYGTYFWSNQSTTPTIEVFETGEVTVTVTDSNGCTAVGSIDVVLGESPEITVSGGDLNCCTPETTLSGTSSIEDVEYLWEGSNGFVANEATTVATTAGIYTFTATAPNGCASSMSYEVLKESTIMPLSAFAQMITCTETAVQIEATEYPNGTYYWTGPNNFTSTESNPIVTEGGIYTVVYESVDCCQSTMSIEVESDQNPPDIFVPNYTLSCQQTEIILIAQASISGLDYQWTNFGGFLSESSEPTITEAGSYTLQATNPNNGCTNIFSFEVDEIPALEINFLSENTCVNATDGIIELTQLAGGQAPYTIEWAEFDNNDFSYENLAAGDYHYQITDSGDCIENGVVTVEGLAPQVAIEIEELEMCKAEMTLLDPTLLYDLPESATFEWNNGMTTPQITVIEAGIYSVNIFKECETFVHVFEVKEKAEKPNSIFVPNAFSPNGDGINDTFLPVSGKEMYDYTLSVYDRWGNLMYQNTDSTQGWDGKLHNKTLDNGVFIYHLKANVDNCNGEIVQLDRIGDLTLLR